MADLDELAARLDQLSEDLADAALAALREALDAGERKPELERRLTRARRSVERAALIIHGQGSTSED